MVGFWTAMAENGNPGDLWPEYTSGTTAGINIANGSSSVSPGQVDYSVYAFWSQVSAVAAGNGSSATSSGAGPVATYSSGAGKSGKENLWSLIVGIMAGVNLVNML